MSIYLTSRAIVKVREGESVVDCYLNNENNFIDILKQELGNKPIRFLFIANNPRHFEENKQSSNYVVDAFKAQGFSLIKTDVLDGSNYKNAKNLISNADVIYIQGGKIKCLIDFLKSIKANLYLNKYNGIIIGQSAGAMSFGKLVYNYPEEDCEINQEKWIKGFGPSNLVLIPHFNITTGNDFCFGNFNLLKDFYLPDSNVKKLFAIPDGSFVKIENRKNHYVFGEAYLIDQGIIQKVSNNGEMICFKHI